MHDTFLYQRNDQDNMKGALASNQCRVDIESASIWVYCKEVLALPFMHHLNAVHVTKQQDEVEVYMPV